MRRPLLETFVSTLDHDRAADVSANLAQEFDYYVHIIRDANTRT